MYFYCYFAKRTNFIGFPPHTWFAGTTLPGGTTLFGSRTAPSYMRAPSKITQLDPTKTPVPS
jgi:hypothetical protein